VLLSPIYATLFICIGFGLALYFLLSFAENRELGGCLMNTKWRWRRRGGFIMKTIRGKIFVLFAVCLAFVVVLTILYYASINSLEKKLVIIQDFDDLRDDVLEMRRYEKNYIYNGDIGSLQESIFYLVRVEDRSNRLGEQIKRVIGHHELLEFKNNLVAYRRAIEEGMTLGKANSDQIHVDRIRARGKALVDFAQRLTLTKRQRIQKALTRTLIIPLAFLGSFLVVAIVTFLVVAKGILKPLGLVERATDAVAKGTFAPLSYAEEKRDEISHLIAAFNKMAQELELRQEQLVQSRKMASIGTFTSGIAHELNNPINNISLIVESLMEEEEGLERSERLRLYRDIMTQADRSSEIVKNLLEFSRATHPRMEELSLEQVVDTTALLVRNELRLNHIKFSKQVQGDLPLLRADKGGMQQVLLNLFLNSIHAMKDGGGEIRVILGLVDNLNEVRIDVEDTGKGIPPEHLNSIFDPFFTTKKEREGTGLGLSVTYNVIKKHGGRIEVQSVPDRGTCFSIFLPIGGADEPSRRTETSSNSRY
jgi:two-component system NtrC family sensor kinase